MKLENEKEDKKDETERSIRDARTKLVNPASQELPVFGPGTQEPPIKGTTRYHLNSALLKFFGPREKNTPTICLNWYEEGRRKKAIFDPQHREHDLSPAAVARLKEVFKGPNADLLPGPFPSHAHK
jgi:hypothetical protein